MPMFEVETEGHIMIIWAQDKDQARQFSTDNYPAETITRVTHRPRDAWVISKKLLGIEGSGSPCDTARECFGESQRRQAARYPAIHA